jgi:hypothetical protein
MTLKEKLIFQLEKRSLSITETVTGGSDRYFSNLSKILKIKNPYIYTNLLLTNALLNNKSNMHLISLNAVAPKKEQRQPICLTPYNKMEGTSTMQTKLKPKRFTLKVKEQGLCPSNINDTIVLLEKNDFDLKSIPKVLVSELFYFLENKIFYGYGANNPDIIPIDLHKLFKFNMPKTNKFLEAHDRKLFKILINLYKNTPYIFNDSEMIKFVFKMMGYWNACAKNPKDNVRKFNGIHITTKTITGFKVFISMMSLLTNNFSYNKDFLKSYEEIFIRAIQRYFNYSYILNLPQNIKFELTLIDPNDRKQFLKCLTLDEDAFQDFINTSRRVYQEKPENQKSMRNLKEIFADSFYYKSKPEGKKRFEQFRPRFARWLEILIHRIEKYSDNGKRVELCGLKLTAETQTDAPVLYYYFEWLKKQVFEQTHFQFDEMFSLQNWNIFIKDFMRQERGYTDYWKVIDKN